METTADQVLKPVYREAIDRWKGHIPKVIQADLILRVKKQHLKMEKKN
jgi:hypothetical protein